ncbi:hypothetical protein MA16_Dca001271 [Dendrobium catenatum]|uniref:Uncharacterized protein n=1 Tax=Dendrobium catenatum TaxID=906689 RepID=A0A2I0WLX8_9ASPA|nr:hypothetical protein MA16_Dca001271 [Dendrobium catenatum]
MAADYPAGIMANLAVISANSARDFKNPKVISGVSSVHKPEVVTPYSDVDLKFKKSMVVKDKSTVIKNGYSSNPKHKLFKELQTLGPLEVIPIRTADSKISNHKGDFSPTKEFRWLPEYSMRIRTNFERRGATRLRDMFMDIRKSGQRPNWIGEGVWADLSSAWATPEFIKMREQNKQNRASDCGGLGSSLHTGGSVPHTEHRRRLDDFVRARESRQSTGEGASSGSAHIYEYQTWSEVVGGRQRGRVYGMGSQAYAIEGSSSTSAFHNPSGAEESVLRVFGGQPAVWPPVTTILDGLSYATGNSLKPMVLYWKLPTATGRYPVKARRCMSPVIPLALTAGRHR